MNIEDASAVYGSETSVARDRTERTIANYLTTSVPAVLIVDSSGPISERSLEFTVAVDLDALSAPPCVSGTLDCGDAELDNTPVESEPPSPVDGGLSLIDPESPQAQALEYRNVSIVLGQNCGNCALYRGEQLDSAFGSCPLFPGSRTRAQAWCAAYVPTD